MKILAIGYGNTLRGDDGIGPWVAEQIAVQQWPEVRSLSVPQLTPELAAEIAEADVVFFIDAWATEAQRPQARIVALSAPTQSRRLDHLWTPNVLLYLAQSLYNTTPTAYQILIPATRFDYGAPFSDVARAGADWAIATLRNCLQASGQCLSLLPLLETA
ncbi:MAG TPA: hydrogenase maturation protease [Stenomitos sp.]